MRDRERRLDKRLHAVTTRMTVRQRVAALLAAGRDGTRRCPTSIGRGLTPAGWAAFRRDCAERARSAPRDRPRLPGPGRVRDRHDCQWIVGPAHVHDHPARHPGGGAVAGRARRLVSSRRGPGGGGRPGPRRGGAHKSCRACCGSSCRTWRAPRSQNGRVRRWTPCSATASATRTISLRALEIEIAAFAADLAADPLDPDLHAQADRCHDGTRGAHRFARAGPAHRADRAVRRRGRRDRRALPPRGRIGGRPRVSYLPDPDPIAPLTIRYLWYRSGGW